MTLTALDEYPVHQAPLPMAEVATSDRNFYDRCYFNAHDRTGEIMLVTGLGVYPNLGVTDCFATVRRGDRQWAVRFSGALGGDRREQRVGPYRIEVLEPLHRIRLVCDGDAHGIGFDLTWTGSFPAVLEQPHRIDTGFRTIVNAARFAQVGSWDGELRVGDRRVAVADDRWLGTRDRSWGIRPVGEPEPTGRGDPTQGFWWLYAPLRFDRFAIVVIVQERPDGFRTLNDAVRVWPDGRVEQLGWPRVAVRYAVRTRAPTGATLTCATAAGDPVVVEIETLPGIALNVGAGYGGDPDWGHGRWCGPEHADGAVYDLTDPAVTGRVPYSVVDHPARATCAGEVGWGLFEHASIGRHDPSGFADWAAVAT